MLQHYVFLAKYGRHDRSAHRYLCERVSSLRDTIGGIEHLEIGQDELHATRSRDLVLIMQFASVEGLRAYQRHPDHLAVMAFNDPFVANAASVDFTPTARLSFS